MGKSAAGPHRLKTTREFYLRRGERAAKMEVREIKELTLTLARTSDVTETLNLALQAAGLDQANVVNRPRLLSDNGSSYISGDLAKWLEGRGMQHSRGAPYRPMTQGKIERWHQTLKNRIMLEHYYVPGDLRAQIETFIEHYNHRRYHERLGNLTPADVFSGRGQTILLERERIK